MQDRVVDHPSDAGRERSAVLVDERDLVAESLPQRPHGGLVDHGRGGLVLRCLRSQHVPRIAAGARGLEEREPAGQRARIDAHDRRYLSPCETPAGGVVALADPQVDDVHVREIGVGQTVEATPVGRVEVVRHGDRALAHQREPACPAGGIVVRGESVPAEDGHAEEHEHPEGQDADRGEAPASPPAEVSPRET